MKFYSEITKKFYDTPEQCETAEHEVVAAQEAKRHEQAILLDGLAKLKAEYDELNTMAIEASKNARKAYGDLTNAVHSYYNKYGSIPKEFSNLTFMTDVFNDIKKFFG